MFKKCHKFDFFFNYLNPSKNKGDSSNLKRLSSPSMEIITNPSKKIGKNNTDNSDSNNENEENDDLDATEINDEPDLENEIRKRYEKLVQFYGLI